MSDKKINLVSQRLNLSLFLLSRNSYRQDYSRRVQNYVGDHRSFLTENCVKENAVETRTTAQLKHFLGKYPKNVGPCIKRRTKDMREGTASKPWQLPPNCYDSGKEPFKSKRGSSGAYWRKLPPKPVVSVTKEKGPQTEKRSGTWRLYDLSQDYERMSMRCNKYKGVFLSNARQNAASSRCMILDPTQLRRNPDDPSPAHYVPHQHELGYNLEKVKRDPIPISVSNPHRFMPHSCVSSRTSSLVPLHSSFKPGPGRYETRYRHVCACSSRKIYKPGLELIVDHEKRRKFRRLAYKKYELQKYCSPDLAHISGHGHHYLFQLPSSDASKKPKPPKKADGTVKVGKTLQLFPEARYIFMINQPDRRLLSRRSVPVATRPPAVRYNCIARRPMRRHLQNNKKIVFNSGAERFPDSDYRPVQLTFKQLEKIKESLPVDRQLRDYPIFNKAPSEIQSQLYKVPEHLKATFQPDLRKRLFKFLPLPEPKILVSDKDLLPESSEGLPYQPRFFYNKPVDPTNFMKKEFQDSFANEGLLEGNTEQSSAVNQRENSTLLEGTQSQFTTGVEKRDSKAAAEIEKAETKAAAEFSKPELKAAADIEKPESNAVAEFDKPQLNPAADIEKPESNAVVEFDKPLSKASAKIDTLDPKSSAEIDKSKIDGETLQIKASFAP